MPSNILRRVFSVFLLAIFTVSSIEMRSGVHFSMVTPAEALGDLSGDSDHITTAEDYASRVDKKDKNPETKDREKPKSCKKAQKEAKGACSGGNPMGGLGDQFGTLYPIRQAIERRALA